MTDPAKTNEILRRAMAEARLRDVDIAANLGVDPKTVQRWLAGRTPQPRHRWGVASLVGRHEYDLWPELVGAGAANIGHELHATYPHRSAVPREVWRALFETATTEIGILVYSGLFLAEDAGVMRILRERAAAGVTVRILLGDPDSRHVAARGLDEGITDAMPAKVRNAIVLYRPLAAIPGIEIRLHGTVLYTSMYRADDDIVVNPHIYGIAAAYAPILHLRRSADDDLTGAYLTAFERVWGSATPLDATASSAPVNGRQVQHA